eukprot:11268-Heterococcus_DN1.PRE.2
MRLETTIRARPPSAHQLVYPDFKKSDVQLVEVIFRLGGGAAVQCLHFQSTLLVIRLVSVSPEQVSAAAALTGGRSVARILDYALQFGGHLVSVSEGATLLAEAPKYRFELETEPLVELYARIDTYLDRVEQSCVQ